MYFPKTTEAVSFNFFTAHGTGADQTSWSKIFSVPIVMAAESYIGVAYDYNSSADTLKARGMVLRRKW